MTDETGEPLLPPPMSDDPEGERAEKEAAAQESGDRDITPEIQDRIESEIEADIAKKILNPTEERALREHRYHELKNLIGLFGLTGGLSEDQFKEQMEEFENLRREFER